MKIVGKYSTLVYILSPVAQSNCWWLVSSILRLWSMANIYTMCSSSTDWTIKSTSPWDFKPHLKRDEVVLYHCRKNTQQYFLTSNFMYIPILHQVSYGEFKETLKGWCVGATWDEGRAFSILLRVCLCFSFSIQISVSKLVICRKRCCVHAHFHRNAVSKRWFKVHKDRH